MPFDFGDFAGGVSSGIGQGQAIRQRQMEMQAARRAQAARADVGNMLMQGDPAAPMPGQGATPVPMPGATPMPVGMGGPQQAAAPSPAPAPMQPGPADTSMAVPPMLRAPQPAAPGPTGGPQPAPAAPGPAQAQGGPQGGLPGASGGAGDVDYTKAFQASQNLLKSVARQIQQANPGKKWKDPAELLDAVEAQIKALDSVNPMEKIAAQAQLAGSRAQYEYWTAQTRQQQADERTRADQSREEETRRQHDLQHQDRTAKMDQAWKIAKASNDTKTKLEAMREASRLTVEEMIQGGENSRAGALLQFRYAAQQAGLDEKTAIAELQAEAKAQGVNLSTEAGIDKAEIGMGKTPSQPLKPMTAPKMKGAKIAQPAGGGGAKPLPQSTLDQWKQVPAQNKAAAKKHLQDQGFDVSGLS